MSFENTQAELTFTAAYRSDRSIYRSRSMAIGYFCSDAILFTWFGRWIYPWAKKAISKDIIVSYNYFEDMIMTLVGTAGTLILSTESALANGIIKRESQPNPTLAKWQKSEVRHRKWFVSFWSSYLVPQPHLVSKGIQSSLSRLKPNFLSYELSPGSSSIERDAYVENSSNGSVGAKTNLREILGKLGLRTEYIKEAINLFLKSMPAEFETIMKAHFELLVRIREKKLKMPMLRKDWYIWKRVWNVD